MPDMTPWLKIRARYEAGERIPMAVRKMAEEVLGERFIRRVAVQRPDFRDREAGDDSFDDGRDGGMVVL